MEEEKKKKRVRKKEAEAKKEEISEVFEVEKDDKEKIVETHAIEKIEEKPVSETQVKKENKVLRNLIITMVGFILMFLVVYILVSSMKTFEYEGIKFEIVKEGQLMLYSTFIPVLYNGSVVDYYIYLRKDPRSSPSFEGELAIEPNMVINATNSFNCDGDGVIAIANLVKLYELINTKVIKDDNATCDFSGRYMFLRIQEGNETKVEQFGPSCYNIYVHNCEILRGTEKFMIETLSQMNKAK